MKSFRLFLSICAAVVVGGVAHAGDFALGAANLIAQNTARAGVEVGVTFADPARAMHEGGSESGDARACSTRNLRGADADATCADANAAAAATTRKSSSAPIAEPVHAPPITPAAAAIRHPSYRWQSLVPGAIR